MAGLTRSFKLTRLERHNVLIGLLFASPWIFGFLLFTLIPLGASLYFSLTRYDLLTPPRFIGFVNYVNLFTDDDDFRVVMVNTLWWVAIAAPLGVISAFFMAVLLNTNIVARSFFRAVFFFPSIVPVVVTAFVWLFLLNVQYGAINSTLRGWGLASIPFLSSPDLVKPSLVVIHMWAQGGAMVIFLATLQDVPRSLYEAATIDGANALQRLIRVTIPMVSPVILFNLVLSLIGGFQFFTLPYILNPLGGPNKATLFYAVFIYRNAFSYMRMDKAAALSWVLFVMVMLITYVLFRASGRFIYYAGSNR